MPLPTRQQLSAARQLHSQMAGGNATNAVIELLFREHPSNANRFVVLGKVRLINALYSTRIIADRRLADNIADRHEDIQPLLDEGDAQAVEQIALCGVTKVKVFATKYAHFCQPNSFSMRDGYVDDALKALELSPTKGQTITQWYQNYRDVIDRIRQHLGCASYREVDHYLWLKGQKIAAENGRADKLSGEVRWVMAEFPQIWLQL